LPTWWVIFEGGRLASHKTAIRIDEFVYDESISLVIARKIGMITPRVLIVKDDRRMRRRERTARVPFSQLRHIQGHRL
jgi:hypothetical protein